jgi:hypothetical protein
MLRDVIVALASRSREMVRRYEARERERYHRSKPWLKRSS